MARLGERFTEHARGIGAASGSLRASDAATAPFTAAGDGRARLTEIALSQIEPDPDQPRRDLGDLSELSASIRALGLIQPIIVSIIGYERYRILAGERRFTAAGQVGLATIPAIVRSAEEHRRLELQLVENLHRKDLNPFEEAAGYQRLLAEFRLTHEELGKRLGKTQVSVTETLLVLNLPDHIREEVRGGGGGRISKSLLLEMARRPRTEHDRLWEAAKRGELTVQKVRAERQAAHQAGTKRADKTTGPRGAATRTFRYPIELVANHAVVTVEFANARPRLEDVVAALEEALDLEKARIAR